HHGIRRRRPRRESDHRRSRRQSGTYPNQRPCRAEEARRVSAELGMSALHMKRTFPALLRIFTLGMRFLLVFFLARFLPVEDVGLYGLLFATISFVVFIFGFDFYTYATRQLIRAEDLSKRSMLKSQFALTLVLYGIIGPLLILLFTTGLLPWSMVLWFVLLVPLEHAGLELDRILIALGDQMGSSLGLFIRQ